MGAQAGAKTAFWEIFLGFLHREEP